VRATKGEEPPAETDEADFKEDGTDP